MTRIFDVAFARRHFPPLKNGWAFFENAGGTYVPQSVIDRTEAYMRECQVQPAWTFAPSADAAARIAEGKRTMAAIINAEPDEIIVGPSTTMNVYMMAQAIRHWFKPGDELIVTEQDHEANVGGWRRLAEFGVTIREWQIDPRSGALEMSGLDALLGPRTRHVAMTHCSNVIGIVHDIPAIAAKVHAVGATLMVDGVAFAPHFAIDVKALDVDFYAFSAYKLFGPHLAVLYGKREHFLRAKGQNHFFIGEDDIPLKLLPGGMNHELGAGLVGVTDYFEALDAHHFDQPANSLHGKVRRVYELAVAHEAKLAERIEAFLKTRPGVHIYGRRPTNDGRLSPNIAFTVAGHSSKAIAEALYKDKIAVGFGDFYAARCIKGLGLTAEDGVVRVGIAHYNDDGDVDRLLAALDRVLPR
ncbi:MAG: aminotransferase class V-fold PLP-dependent enzyme [Dongiaceae bacterium]